MTSIGIRPAGLENIAEYKQGFSIIERHGSKQTSHPAAGRLINLLKKNYPELAEANPTQKNFLSALFDKLKKEMPKNTSHQKFAENVIEEISKNPKIKAEAENLKKILYYA